MSNHDPKYIPVPRQGPTVLAAETKAQDSADRYLDASVSVIEGSGTKGAKARPFRQDLAVRSFGSWIYAAAMLNANAFASVPIRLYVRSRSGRKLFRTRAVPKSKFRYLAGDYGNRKIRPSRSVMTKVAEYGEDFEEVTEPHPALKVLAGANEWQNGYELSVLRSLYWQVTGNAYIHPIMDSAMGVPAELWVMPSQWTKIIPSRTEFIAGYVYGRNAAEELKFTPDEVIQWKLPNLNDLYYGFGKAEAAWGALGLHNAKRSLDQAKLDNHARPDWLLSVENATPDSLKRVEDKIDARLKGSRNAGRFLAVNSKVKATALQWEIEEIGDPDKVIEEIAAIFGVPLYKLRGNDPIKANSEVQDAGWLRDTILPYCRYDEEQLNARYLPLFGIEGDAFLAYDNPVEDDEAKTVDRLTKYVSGTILLSNEARAELGYAPVPGGDVLLVPGKARPLTDASDDALNVSPAPNSDSSNDPTQAGSSQHIQTTQATVLNGAQVTSATEIVTSVAAGDLPRDAGLGMLQTFFNLTPEKAELVMGSAGNPKVPTTPNPKPVQSSDQLDTSKPNPESALAAEGS